LTPRIRNALVAIVVTAIVAVALVQLTTQQVSAQSVSINNLPGTVVLGKNYDVYVTINLQGIAKIYPNSTISLIVYSSSGSAVATAQFNGTGVVISTGGFLVSTTLHNGTPAKLYGYGGSTGYLSFLAVINFPPGGAVSAGKYTMSALLRIFPSSSPISSSPVVFNLSKKETAFPFLLIFIIADIIVIVVVAWLVVAMRKRRK